MARGPRPAGGPHLALGPVAREVVRDERLPRSRPVRRRGERGAAGARRAKGQLRGRGEPRAEAQGVAQAGVVVAVGGGGAGPEPDAGGQAVAELGGEVRGEGDHRDAVAQAVADLVGDDIAAAGRV